MTEDDDFLARAQLAEAEADARRERAQHAITSDLLAAARDEIAGLLVKLCDAEQVAAERVGGDPALRDLLLQEFGTTDPGLLADILIANRTRDTDECALRAWHAIELEKATAQLKGLRETIANAITDLAARHIDRTIDNLRAAIAARREIRPDLPDAAEIFVRISVLLQMPDAQLTSGSNTQTFTIGDVRAYADPAAHVGHRLTEQFDNLRAGLLDRILTVPPTQGEGQ